MTKKKEKGFKTAVVIMVEGETEVEFYTKVLQKIHSKWPTVSSKFSIKKPINMKGISNFQRSAVTQFEHLVKKDDKEKKQCSSNIQFEYHVFLCIDTDVFYYQENPPLNCESLKEDLISNGAKSVHYIEADQSIEDWFLSDLQGVQRYLKLKKISPGYKNKLKGVDRLKALFRQAGKSYIKGRKSEGFVAELDVLKIMQCYSTQFQCLLDLLGISL